MIFTFYKARGLAVGSSLVEEDKLALAKELEEKAKVGAGQAKGAVECGAGRRDAGQGWVGRGAGRRDARQGRVGRGKGRAHEDQGTVLVSGKGVLSCRLALAAWPTTKWPTSRCPQPPCLFLLQAKGVEFVLPTDVVVADKFAPDAETQVVDVNSIPDGWMVSCSSPGCASLALRCIASIRPLV